MNREDALRCILSDEAETRLSGARFLALNSRCEDAAAIRRSLNREKIPWIRRALERAVERAGTSRSARRSSIEVKSLDLPPLTMIDDLRAEAVEEVTGTIVHEMAPVIGLLRVQARREIPNYESSQSRSLVELLNTFLGGIRELKSAVATPRFVALDLPKLVRSVCPAFEDGHREWIRIAGHDPFPVVVDRSQLCLALQNTLRNAIEAVAEFSSKNPPEVIINWGHAGAEDWLAVIDSGPGFPAEPAEALRLGSTTKDAHIGFGLATAQQAMRRMEGDVYVSNGPDGGARVELRWYRDHAHIDSGR